MTSERDGLKAKLRKTELDLEQIKTENQGFREERDRLRRRVGPLLYHWSHVTLRAKCLEKKNSNLLGVNQLRICAETNRNLTYLKTIMHLVLPNVKIRN